MDVIVLGSYERFLVGYTYKSSSSSTATTTTTTTTTVASPSSTLAAQSAATATGLRRRFCTAAHLGPVRCVSAGGVGSRSTLVASGGADDTVRVLDVFGMRDRGSLLTRHTGDVASLALYVPPACTTPSHIFSGGHDGSIAVWEAADMNHVKTLWAPAMATYTKPSSSTAAMKHREDPAAVSAMAVHGSGCVLMSAAADKTMSVWNLSSGRCTYRHKVADVVRSIHFLDDGVGASSSVYAACFDARIAVHDAERGSMVGVFGSPDGVRMNDTTVLNGLVLGGLESGAICGWDVRVAASDSVRESIHGSGGGGGGAVFMVDDAHKGSRIKGLSSMPVSGKLCSGSSNGILRVWDLRMVRDSSSDSCVAEADTRARISCLAVGAAVRPVRGPDINIASRDAGGQQRPRRDELSDGVSSEEEEEVEDVNEDEEEEEDEPLATRPNTRWDTRSRGDEDGEMNNHIRASRASRKRFRSTDRVSDTEMSALGAAVRENQLKSSLIKKMNMRTALMRESARFRR